MDTQAFVSGRGLHFEEQSEVMPNALTDRFFENATNSKGGKFET